MADTLLSRDEQRIKARHKLMLSVGLCAHLQNLIREIKAGNINKLTEFQQFVQYAPTEMKSKLLNDLAS